MPPAAVNAQPRYPKTDAILENATLTCGALRTVDDSYYVPFLQSVAAISSAILTAVRSIKVNREECIKLVERIEELIWVSVDVCINSRTGDLLPPAVLNNIGNFARFVGCLCRRTLQKILSFAEDQLKIDEFRRFLRQAENTQQLDECNAELKHALATFPVQCGVTNMAALADLRIAENCRHELLELVAARAASAIADCNFSLLYTPAAISFLATLQKTHGDLSAAVASHRGLEPSPNIVKIIVRHLSAGPPVLLVLDNLETTWKPGSFRHDVEEFLALLTDVAHLALLAHKSAPDSAILTAVGTAGATRETFLNISDEGHDHVDVRELLRLANHLPLAVNQIANVVSFGDTSSAASLEELKHYRTLSCPKSQWAVAALDLLQVEFGRWSRTRMSEDEKYGLVPDREWPGTGKEEKYT
ncbi:hypothetical protein DFH09DRAFT_1084636 [Mycena vulgaris]|nr:hypothetical protein DFH09DRAFT_1084636 [Mycena vulgaris]